MDVPERDRLLVEALVELLSSLAHALNNPLGAIVLAAGFIKDEGSDDVADLAGSIESEALRTSEILADVRAACESIGPSTPGPVDILAAVVEGIGPGAFVEPGPAPVVVATRARIVQAVRLLFGSEAGAVSIVASVDGHRACVTLTATDTETESRPNLVAVQLAALLLAGESATLAFTDTPDRFSAVIELEACTQTPERAILVVDDNAAMVSVLGLLFEGLGWRVLSASSAAEAMLRLETESPACVLVDLHIAGDSGLDLAAGIERDHPGLAGRIAVVTGDRATDLRPYATLYKPFRKAELEALLNRLVGPPP